MSSTELINERASIIIERASLALIGFAFGFTVVLYLCL